MTSHDFAWKLLAGPDLPVVIGYGSTEELWPPETKQMTVLTHDEGEYDGPEEEVIVIIPPCHNDRKRRRETLAESVAKMTADDVAKYPIL